MSNNPSDQPIAVAGPTATQNYDLPNIPANAYNLLIQLADAIDTVNRQLNGHAGKLSDIHASTNNAVSEVTTTSKGQATDTLHNLWQNSQTDLTHAHDQLSAITTARNGIGPGPNDFRSTLDANKNSIQIGLIALAALEKQQSYSVPTVSTQQIEQWKQDVNNLNASIGNINMALEIITMSIITLNNGFSNVCATGLVPGLPVPVFNQNAFANQSHDSSGSGSNSEGSSESNSPKTTPEGSSESNSPKTTPEGRPLSKHASWNSLNRHGITPAQVDDIIDNYSRKTTQIDGATVFIKKQAGRSKDYSVVIMGDQGVVTALRDLSKTDLDRLGRNHGFDPNP